MISACSLNNRRLSQSQTNPNVLSHSIHTLSPTQLGTEEMGLGSMSLNALGHKDNPKVTHTLMPGPTVN